MKSPFARDLFKEQVVLITGGGTGIGLTTARLFAYSGARIIISGRRLEPLHAAQAKIEAMGARCLSVTCDIREPDDTQSLINACIEKYGQLDVLINNAAVMKCRKSITAEGIEQQLGVNYMGHLLLSHLLKPSLKASSNGNAR